MLLTCRRCSPRDDGGRARGEVQGRAARTTRSDGEAAATLRRLRRGCCGHGRRWQRRHTGITQDAREVAPGTRERVAGTPTTRRPRRGHTCGPRRTRAQGRAGGTRTATLGQVCRGGLAWRHCRAWVHGRATTQAGRRAGWPPRSRAPAQAGHAGGGAGAAGWASPPVAT
jgi:hypothetical protein